jgi:hypothetical protein
MVYIYWTSGRLVSSLRQAVFGTSAAAVRFAQSVCSMVRRLKAHSTGVQGDISLLVAGGIPPSEWASAAGQAGTWPPLHLADLPAAKHTCCCCCCCCCRETKNTLFHKVTIHKPFVSLFICIPTKTILTMAVCVLES